MESGEEFPPKRILTMIATNEIETIETPEAIRRESCTRQETHQRSQTARQPPERRLKSRAGDGCRPPPFQLERIRNGLNGQIVCSTPEELAAFKSFCSEIQNELAPVGTIERFYAKSVAENMYRLEKARSLDMGMFANGHRDHVDEMQSGHPEADTALAASRTFLEQADAFKLLSGYEVEDPAGSGKASGAVEGPPDRRKAAHEKAVEQATQFVELAEAMEETYEPGEDFTPASAHGGFNYSCMIASNSI